LIRDAMSDPAFADPRTLLRRYQLAAKKSWGQNFLVSERAYRAIVDAAVSSSADFIVEIGAGLGTLTARLAQRAADGMVIAIERDRDLVAVLEGELGHLDNVQIEPANALTYDLSAAARWAGQRLSVCGNLPYQIASPLLFRIIEARADVERAVVMLQREMADRLLAAPGSRTYGAMTVLVASYAAVERIAHVRASGFTPPPRVDSTVIRLRFPEGGEPLVPIADPAAHNELVHAAFAMRRKTLRNNLRDRWGEERADRALAAASIDGARRAETLSTAEFAALAAAVADA
jgi:16S rRNA (adenine1518-N6/adenine1519-N6)-dimethyltransferase